MLDGGNCSMEGISQWKELVDRGNRSTEAIARRRRWGGNCWNSSLSGRRRLGDGGNCSMEGISQRKELVDRGNRSTEAIARQRRWGGNCWNSSLSRRRRLLGGSQGRRRQWSTEAIARRRELLDGGNGQRRQSLDGGASLEEMPCPTEAMEGCRWRSCHA